MRYNKTLNIANTNALEMARRLADLSDFPPGSQCWDFGETWSKETEHYPKMLRGASVWHKDTIDRHNVVGDLDYIIASEPDIYVKQSDDTYEITYSEKVSESSIERLSITMKPN